ncbi:hypothetical protein [Roseivivax sp.]
MILTLLVAAAAGYAVEPLLPRLTEFLWRNLPEERLPDEAGRRVLGFALALAGASALLWVLRADQHPLPLIAGGLVGYFHEELRAAIAARRN